MKSPGSAAIAWVGAAVSIFAALSVSARETILDTYVHQALESNLALTQQDFSYQESIADLRQARAGFFPSLDILARYTRAEGGRVFEFPIGDIVNPIHAALNQITGEDEFPTDVRNQTISFLREKEQETKIEIVQPIFQPAVYYNYRVMSSRADAGRASRDQFKHDLVKEVRTAYFSYLKAVNLVDLAQRTEELLDEHLRVSQSLYENGKATRDVVYRARAELSKAQQSRADAEKGSYLTRAYFNFLLNRPLDESIEIMSLPSEPADPPLTLSDAVRRALEKRLEIRQADRGLEAADNALKLARTGYLPGLSLSFDYGIQGEKYRISDEDDFWTASLVLQWNLFDGLGKNAKINQAKLEKSKMDARREEIVRRIELEVGDTYRTLTVAKQNIATSTDQVESASKSFEIVNRKFQEGVASHVEFIDARTAMTSAEISRIVAVCDYLISYAEFERVTALYPLGDGK
jgi:outer membrane protein